MCVLWIRKHECGRSRCVKVPARFRLRAFCRYRRPVGISTIFFLVVSRGSNDFLFVRHSRGLRAVDNHGIRSQTTQRSAGRVLELRSHWWRRPGNKRGGNIYGCRVLRGSLPERQMHRGRLYLRIQFFRSPSVSIHSPLRRRPAAI